MARKVNTSHADYMTNQSTLDALVADVTEYARKVCIRRGVDPVDSEDVAQEVAVHVWLNLSKFDPSRSQFQGWVNRCILDQLSARSRKAGRHEKDVAAQNPDSHELREPSYALISRIRSAAGASVEVVDLMAVHGDVATVAKLLEITPKAVRRRLEKIKLAVEGKTVRVSADYM